MNFKDGITDRYGSANPNYVFNKITAEISCQSIDGVVDYIVYNHTIQRSTNDHQFK